jgi:hypothetical protein
LQKCYSIYSIFNAFGLFKHRRCKGLLVGILLQLAGTKGARDATLLLLTLVKTNGGKGNKGLQENNQKIVPKQTPVI